MKKRLLVVPNLELVGGAMKLEGDEAHHARNVWRLMKGAELEITDGRGRVADALVVDSRRALLVEITAIREIAPPSHAIVVFQAVAKSDKVDRVVRQVAELGATRFVPITTERTVAEREHKVERWRSIAADAARVSERAHLMAVESVVPLGEALVGARCERSVAFCGTGDATVESLEIPGVRSVEVLIGPEGGLSERELELLRGQGFALATLGRHTLRTETAGPAVVAIVAYLLGQLRA